MTRKQEPGILASGWRLLWQTQRILWWIFAVNLCLGFLSAVGLSLRLGPVMDHSLAAQRLYHGFDLAYFIELASNPGVQLATRPTNALSFATVFFVFMLFATGGILESYARNRMLVPGEFFQGCGAFFWRFVRLLLWLMVVLLPLAGVTVLGNNLLDRLLSAASERTEFLVRVAALGLLALVLMLVRLWFDMAQVRAVVEDERGMTRALLRAFQLTWSNLGTLFWMYLRPSLVGWAGTVLALYIWIKFVPAEQITLGLLLGQFIAWLWIATRLWQRTSEVIWYQRQRPEPELTTIDIGLLETREVAPPEE